MRNEEMRQHDLQERYRLELLVAGRIDDMRSSLRLLAALASARAFPQQA